VVIQNIKFEVVPHPAYSADLAPSDFWLCAALKQRLKDTHFTCDKEVQAATENRIQDSLKSSTVTSSKTCSVVAVLH
jgi:hypothetical protein